MGLENRDYARDGYSHQGWGYGHGSGGIQGWEVWKKLILLNVAIYVLQIFITRPATVEDFEQSPFFAPELLNNQQLSEEDLQALASEAYQEMLSYAPQVSVVQDWLELDSDKVLAGQIWRLVTSGFCHDTTSVWHLVFNMLFLFWFGQRLEFRLGRMEFAAFYVTSLLVASLTYIAIDLYTNTHIPAIGASGAIWGVVALFALLYPYEHVYIYFLFPIQIRFLAIIYFALDLHPLVLQLAGQPTYSDGVAHAAHVGGALFGFFYWQQKWSLLPILSRLTPWLGMASSRTIPTRDNRDLRRPGSKSPIDRQPPPDSRLDHSLSTQLDMILEKLGREGREALSEEELETLEQASRKLREGKE